VLRGDPAEPRWAACRLSGGLLTAVLTVNRPRDIVAAQVALADPKPVDPGRLADPSIRSPG
jgi:3-phenylpropionate/trans-cinnamate dioxygenase ferredoxin reductase subunit